MRQIFTFLSAFDNYSTSDFRADLVAGLTVGVMLIPQGMAYAMIAGLPPQYGLYAGIFPPILYAIFGSSRQLSVGPAAMDSMLVAASLVTIVAVDSQGYVSTAILLALMVGTLQLILGILKLGFIINFVSVPVIKGFIYAVAVTIAVSQLSSLFGLYLDRSEYIFDSAIQFFDKIDSLNVITVTISIVSILILTVLKKIHNKIPGGLLLLIVGILISSYFSLNTIGVDIVGVVPEGLPAFSVPIFDATVIRTLLPATFTLALIGFLEAISVGKTIQQNHKKEYDILPNRELVGLGAGNFVGSFFGSFPTTGGLSRSVVSDGAGAKSIVSTLISVLLIVLTLVFLTPVIYFLPKAILSAIIIVAVLGLIDLKRVSDLWKNDRYDFYLLIFTFLITLIFGIEKGVMLGIVLSLLVLVYKTSDPHMAMLGKVKGTDHYRNLARYETAIDEPELAILRFDARLYFANISALKEKIERVVVEKPELRVFILDAQSISDVDSTGLEGLNDIFEILKEAKVLFVMVSVIGPVRDKLKKSGFVDKAGLDHFYPSIAAALDDSMSSFQFQTNS